MHIENIGRCLNTAPPRQNCFSGHPACESVERYSAATSALAGDAGTALRSPFTFHLAEHRDTSKAIIFFLLSRWFPHP